MTAETFALAVHDLAGLFVFIECDLPDKIMVSSVYILGYFDGDL